MDVNFNGLRLKSCNDFDKAVEAAIKCREENGNDTAFEDLAEALDDLRFSIASIALCYDDNELKDVLGERTLKSMNEDEDESPFTICECGRPINDCAIKDGGDQHRNRG